MLKNIFTLVHRELGSYFNSAIAYIYLIVFIAVNNSLFMTRYFLMGAADMESYFLTLPLVLFIFIPVITMRLWAEDKKEHTFELLMTLPLRPAELVLGKFLASLIFYMVSLATTLTVPVVLHLTGQPDLGAILGGYAGAFLLGVMFLAVGIFISGLVSEQIVAFVVTTLSCFVIYFSGTDLTASVLDGWISGFGTFLMNNFGAASHLLSFSRGVIDVKDILYFLMTSAVFLLLNGLFLEGRFRPKARLVFSGAVATCLVGLVAFNWIIHDLPLGRFDITQNKIYTVSAAAKKILRDLKAPVWVKLYITPAEKMPTALKGLERDIAGKLQELKVVSNNKFNYKVFHIEAARLLEDKEKEKKTEGQEGATPSLEKTLQEKGIMPYQVESVERDELGVKLVYSALTITYKEKPEEVLPRILPQTVPDLEYLLFSRILKLAQESKPKVAIFSPLRTQEESPEMTELLTRMGQKGPRYEDAYRSLAPLLAGNGYDATRISLTKDDPLPDGVKTLLILNPGTLNDRQLFEINKFLYRGGSALVAAQGLDYGFQLMPPAGLDVVPQQLNLDVNKLLGKWGVAVDDKILMDETNQSISVSTGQRVGPFSLSMPVKIPNQVVVNPETMSKTMPFVTRLPSLMYLWGSALNVADEIIKQSGLKKEVMFTSSQRSWKVPYEAGPLKRESLEFPRGGSEGKFPLAVMLSGQFSNTFAEGALPDWPKKEGEEVAAGTAAPQAGAAKAEMTDPKPGKLIVIGSSKIFTDDLLGQMGDLSLFSNIVDGLTLGDDIIKIRSVSYLSRVLKKVSDSQKVFYRFLTIFLVPILLAAVVFLRLFLRHKEKQFYLMSREK